MSAFRRTEPFATRPVKTLGPIEHDGWRLKVYAVTYGASPLRRDAYDRGLEPALEALPRPAETASRPGVG